MRYLGVDLHKRLVVVCVVEVQEGKRVVVERGRWSNQDTAGMESFLRPKFPFNSWWSRLLATNGSWSWPSRWRTAWCLLIRASCG